MTGRRKSGAGVSAAMMDGTPWRERRWHDGSGPLHPCTPATVRDDLELWDRAPLSGTLSGYADPWWARDGIGRWWVVCWPRSNARRAAGPVCYLVDDHVRLLMSGMRADREVVRATMRHALRRNDSWHYVEDPVSCLLRLPISPDDVMGA